MPGWRRPSNDKVHSDGIIEKGVSARGGTMDPKKVERYLNQPAATRMSDAIKRRPPAKSAAPSSAPSEGMKKRYAPKAIERGVRP